MGILLLAMLLAWVRSCCSCQKGGGGKGMESSRVWAHSCTSWGGDVQRVRAVRDTGLGLDINLWGQQHTAPHPPFLEPDPLI